jgi:putative flippase GtrA
MHWLKSMFEEHKFVRRATLGWACWLITMVVFKTFDSLPEVDGARATLIGTFIGILATVIGFYQWDRSQDDKAKNSKESHFVD